MFKSKIHKQSKELYNKSDTIIMLDKVVIKNIPIHYESLKKHYL